MKEVRETTFFGPEWEQHLFVLFPCIVLRILLFEPHEDSPAAVQELGLAGLGDLIVVMVPKHKPITRKQYDAASQLWPTYFHEDKM